MVAGTHNYYAFIIGDLDFLYSIICGSAFYLYAFLKIAKGRQNGKKDNFLLFFNLFIYGCFICFERDKQ